MKLVRFFANNHFTILQNGAAYFAAILHAIHSARKEIYLETYIFADDEVGNAVKNALKAAALRGVSVCVVLDWLGSGQAVCEQVAAELAEAGGECRVFNPWFTHGIARTHRKICVVDGVKAFVGGINIISDKKPDVDDSVYEPCWDIALKIKGPLVLPIVQNMEVQWVRQGKMSLMSRLWTLRKMHKEEPTRIVGKQGVGGFIVRDNLLHRRTIQRAYLRAIGRAKKSIIMANPYFAPGRKLRRALALAAERGVEVKLLLGVGEFRMQDFVAQSFYPRLLKDGVQLFEYQKAELHGKVAVVDDLFATVGSSNLDGLSLFLNQEANVVIKNHEFSCDLRARIEAAIDEAVPICAEAFSGRPWYKRFTYHVAYIFYRFLMRVVTLGDYS